MLKKISASLIDTSASINQGTKSSIVTEDLQLLSKHLYFSHGLSARDIDRLVRRRKISIIRNGKPIPCSDPRFVLSKNDQIHIKPSDTFHKNNFKSKTRGYVDKNSHDDRGGKSEILWNAVYGDGDAVKSIVYSDDHLLVLNRPHNLAFSNLTLSKHWLRFFEKLSLDPHSLYPISSISSRVGDGAHESSDGSSSGLIYFAKNDRARDLLSLAYYSSFLADTRPTMTSSTDAFGNILHIPSYSNQFHATPAFEDSNISMECDKVEIQHDYWALLSNVPNENSRIIDRHLFVDPDTNAAEIRNPSKTTPYLHQHIHHAKTAFIKLHDIHRKGSWIRLSPSSLVHPHQLRIHCSNKAGLGCPILGDRIYGIKSYKRLFDIGWGQIFDFSKYTGLKSMEGGIPLFLHFRHALLKNYFLWFPPTTTTTSSSSKDGNNTINGEKSIGKGCRVGNDLVLIADLPDIWKQTLKACQIDYSKHKI